jgi:hypothetical protein
MAEKSQADQLAEPFDEVLIYQRTIGGRSFDYVTVAEYIARLNKVVGTGNWNYEILKCHVQPEYKDSIIAHVRVTASVDGQVAVKEAYGGAKVKIMKAGGVMDLGNDFKSAVSDAFKKACQGFGIALHLARKEEALALDVEQSYSVEGEHWQVFTENFKSLDDAKKDLFRAWFKENVPGEDKPNRSLQPELFSKCQVEVLRLMMDAEYVEEKETF